MGASFGSSGSAGGATEATLAEVLDALGLLGTGVRLDATTLAALENTTVTLSNPTPATDVSALATATKQDALKAVADDLAKTTDIAALQAALPASPETGLAKTADVQAVRDRLAAALHADGGAKVHLTNPPTNPETGLATQTTLASLLSTVATAAKQDGMLAQLQAIADNTDGIELSLTDIDLNTDGLETALANTITELGQKLEAGDVTGLATSAKQDSIITSLNAMATQTTSAAILAKLTADPATQTTLAAVLAKLSSDPATQATSAAILAKLSADPATQTTLASVATLLGGGLPTALDGAGRLKVGVSGTVDTELPAAAALTDIDANPMVPGVGAYMMGWNATTWQRIKADSAGLLVKINATSILHADGVANNSFTLPPAAGMLFNGTTWDRVRGAAGTGMATGLAASAIGVWGGGSTWDSLVVANSDSATSTGMPRMAGYVYNGATWDRPRGDATGGLRVQSRADDVTTGSIVASSTAITATVKDGMGACAIEFGGTHAGVTFSLQISFDGGTNYRPYQMVRGDTTGNPVATGIAPGSNVAGFFESSLPPGATHIRVQATAYTSGSMTIRIGQAQEGVETIVAINSGTIGLQAGSLRIGSVQRTAINYSDSVATLAGSGTFTGTARDLLNAASTGTQFPAGYAEEFRGQAISDVVGTLALEVSADNVTWRRIEEVTASTTGTGGLFVAKIRHYPATKYVRLVYTNGAGAQGHFQLASWMY